MKRTKRTSQPRKKAKKKQIKTTTAQKKRKKKVSAALPIILAVAIGDPDNSRLIDSIPGLSIPSPCRPYVSAMVDWLMNQPNPRLLGRDYVIDYRECFEGGENFAFTTTPALILCMSTPVMVAAVAVANNQIPVVGVTSNPGAFPGNVCGVNAQRTNNPYATYYIHFKNKLAGQTITLLTRHGNNVSNLCRDDILGHVNVPLADVNPTTPDPRTAIVSAINNVPPNTGLLVLPVDVFFGFAHKINTTAESRGMKVFWPAEEFARHHHSHYGSPQVVCGQNFGKQADYILSHGAVPSGNNPLQWITVDPR